MSEAGAVKDEPARDPLPSGWDRDNLLVGAIAAVVSLIAFLVYFHAGDILLYGDAVAHINIARRVFDSRTPGPLQLGTVWLPLPHLLILPFITNRWLWQTGIGGSIPSMLAYVLSVIGIFRLARALLNSIGTTRPATRRIAFASSAIFALNPNLLYLQATAMTEPLYLALFVWSAAYLQGFLSLIHGRLSAGTSYSRRILWKSALCAAGACLTRYDGWFLSATLGGALFVLYLREKPGERARARRLLIRFALVLAIAPVLWLAYNAIVYRNPLEFANGPYSAKAIERRSLPVTPSHPGTSNLPLAALYFVKCAEINVAEGRLALFWLVLALGASVALALKQRLATSAVLWSPVAFYALSIAYGGVPIYMPDWYPHSAYNVRYGLQLLPAFAVSVPVAVLVLVESLPSISMKRIATITAALVVAASYFSVWHASPVCYREAFINSRSRLELESLLSAQLSQLPPNASFLMYLGSHVGALEQAGIPLRRSVNEGNHRVWMQPSDPEGLWERSLGDPSRFVDYVVAIDGDPVADAMRSQTLPVLARIPVEGQPPATIYRAR
jgi:hypothetical protein